MKKSFIKYWQSDCDEKELEIVKVYVAPEERHLGKGSALINEAIEYAKNNGFETVSLYVCADEEDVMNDEQLINWYRSFGFESDGDDDCLMTLSL